MKKKLVDILFNEKITLDSIKRTPKIAKYCIIRTSQSLKSMKIGPGKCILLGLACHGAGKILGYYIPLQRQHDSPVDFLVSGLYYLSGWPFSIAGDIFLLAGAGDSVYKTAKKTYRWVKKKVYNMKERAKRYNNYF